MRFGLVALLGLGLAQPAGAGTKSETIRQETLTHELLAGEGAGPALGALDDAAPSRTGDSALADAVAAGVQLSAAPGQEFSFRRVAARPASAVGKRITVQIAIGTPIFPPPDALRPDAELPKVEQQAGRTAEADWFWSRVTPALSGPGTGPVRILDALDTLAEAPSGAVIGGPRLEALQKIADRHGATILRETLGTRVSPALVLAVIAAESAGRADAISSAGASGLMQLMPDTATRFGVTDRTDPAQNIHGGVAYLDWLMAEFNGDEILALAAYNAGEGAVRRNMGVPPYAETRGYVPKVLSAWRVARGLCLTPPELPADGCVLAMRAAAVK